MLDIKHLDSLVPIIPIPRYRIWYLYRCEYPLWLLHGATIVWSF